MFGLFNIRENHGMPVRHDTDWYNVADGLRRELEKVIHFYQTHTQAVQSEHVLMDVLYGINVPINLSLDRFYANVSERAEDLGRALGFTSSVSYGRLFRGKFYHPNNLEIIINIDEDIDYQHAHDNWRNLEPVKVMRHPFSGLGLPIITNRKMGCSDTGLCITTVNIPLLCIQYRAFRLEEKQKAKSIQDYVEKTPQQFIRMFPLTNMLRSYQDMVIFNRLNYLTIGRPLGEDLLPHSFHVQDWSKRLNKIHELMIKRIADGAMDLRTTMKNVPMINLPDLAVFSTLPDVVETRQIEYALISSRLNIIAWLLKVNKDRMYNNNKDVAILNRVKWYFNRLKRNNLLSIKKGSALYFELIEDLMDIEDILKIK